MSRHGAMILAGGDGVRPRPERLAALPVRGVHWDELGDPERVLATRRRTQAMPMREPTLEPISA